MNTSTSDSAQGWGALPTSRRALLAASVLLTMMPVRGHAKLAQAQGAVRPAAGRALDVAATDLFNAAQAGKWSDAAQALGQIRTIAPGLNDLEATYVEAGGNLEDFFQVVNNLSADAMEADTALSTKNQRWLLSCADRVVSRAGELARPFAVGANAIAPRIDTLLFLVRRMQRALVWSDGDGFTNAHAAFVRLWPGLRSELAGKLASAVDAVQRALLNVDTKAPSDAAIKRLYAAIQALALAAA